MKRILSLSLAALALSPVATHAGVGTILVQNNNGGTIIPLFAPDGTTILKGSDFKVGVFVYGGSTVNGIPSLGAQVGGYVSPAASNGRFTGGQQEVPGSLAGGTAQLVVVAWDTRTGADFASAGFKNYSFVFTSPILGGDVDNDPTTPALTASSMALNFKGFPLLIPEPSAIALATLGLGGLIFFSRRK